MANIYHDLWIKASIDQVFEAVSVPKHIDAWWTNQCEGIPKIGSSYSFYFSDQFDWLAEIKDVKKNKHISWTMTKSDKDWDGTSIGFDLTEDDSQVHVQFTHTDWRDINTHFRRTNYCWAMYLRLLKRYVEKGEVIDYDQRNFV